MRSVLRSHLMSRVARGDARWVADVGRKYIALKCLRKVPPWNDGRAVCAPLTASVLVTYRCPSNCGMCTLKESGPARKGRPEMSAADFGTLFYELREMGTHAVSINGGEPLVRRDVFEIISGARAHGLAVSLSTNGLLVDRRIAGRLAAAGLDQITVSLDTLDPADYRAFRGTGRAGALDRVLDAIRLLAEAKKAGRSPMDVIVSTVVRPERPGEIVRIIKTAGGAGADRVLLAPLHRFDRGRTPCRAEAPPDLRSVEEALKAAATQKAIVLDNTPGYLSMFPAAFAGRPFPLPCLAAYASINIDPFGRVFACTAAIMRKEEPVGQYRPGRLAELWNSPAYGTLRKRLLSCRDCYWNCYAEWSILFR